jgi:hypothetical protein
MNSPQRSVKKNLLPRYWLAVCLLDSFTIHDAVDIAWTNDREATIVEIPEHERRRNATEDGNNVRNYTFLRHECE